MSLDSLRMKQQKLQLESDTRDSEEKHEEPESTELDVMESKPQLEHANQEWKQFYEVIKDITNNMRY